MGLYPVAIEAALANIPRGKNSKVYLVDPTTGIGDDDNDGTRWSKPLATLEEAYDRCVANQNDVVLYLGGAQSVSLSAALTWSKNYTHLIGLCAPTHAAQRARIFQLSTLTGASPLLHISASGCIFRDFYIFQGVNDATSLINVKVSGGRNYFGNVHFAGGGHATQAIDGGASLLLDAAEENLFDRCTIGVDTIDAGSGMVGILMDTEAHRNLFRECVIRMRAGNAGAAFVEVVDATGIDRDTLFDRCTLLNNSATLMDSAFVIPSGMGAPRKLLLKDCMILGASKLDANDRGVLFGNMNAVTASDLSGVAVQLIQ